MPGPTDKPRSVETGLPLRVEGLEKTYHPAGRPDLHAVRGISFNISPGECFGLLGPNGAGKSTSMNCIVGFYPATAGTVHLFGIDIAKDPKRARARLGVCSQEDTLDTDFNAIDQMAQYATFFGISRHEGEERARELLTRFGLDEKAEDPVEDLSGGMRRRLQMARALISRPSLLILDEPTTGLDPEARRALWRIIEDFRQSGGAILLSTHYMEEAERLCDRVAIIHDGRILDSASPRDLITRHIAATSVQEEIRPGVIWERPANLEDVYLKVTGCSLRNGTP